MYINSYDLDSLAMFNFFPSKLTPLDDRGPLRVMFCITSMPVGGAETLLVNLVRRMNRERFAPELCCLKELGPLGEVLSREIPAHERLTSGKYDLAVLPRLTQLFRVRKIDAVVTVGAGDKMFWGRLAAWRANVPVIASAIHSTGWPDGINFLNRRLTQITDAFIGVAPSHGQHLVENERFPRQKVHIIPNGVDIERFAPRDNSARIKESVGIPLDAPVIGIVAALRSEKNHDLLLRATEQVLRRRPDVRLAIIGDGPERDRLQSLAAELGIAASVHFLGTRHDIPELLAMLDVFALTSHMEANPVSILEAMATGKPVVAPRVGSIPDTIVDGKTGLLFDAGNLLEVSQHLLAIVEHPKKALEMGADGRDRVVSRWSLEVMVAGYEDLIARIYSSKVRPQPNLGGNSAREPAAGSIATACGDTDSTTRQPCELTEVK